MTRYLPIGAFVVASAVLSAAPQQPKTPAPVDAAAPAPAAPGASAASPSPADELAALPPQGYTYKAEGRRDPFVTLVKRGSDAALTTAAARAAGLAGLNTGEVALRGTIVSQGEWVGMLLGSDEKTYIVRAGDKLADGTIRAITADQLVILQQVKNPLGAPKPREVRKMLRQLDATN